jgi:hypothetical protein
VNPGLPFGRHCRVRFGTLAACGLITLHTLSHAGEAGMGELRRLIGDGACVSDDQCRTSAIGMSACGGPAAYLPWSTLRTDPVAVQRAAARYTRRSAVPPRHGDASTCRVLTDPGALCQPVASSPAAAAVPGGRCTLRPGGGPAAAPVQ